MQDARQHPNYVALWGILVAALVISVLLGEMHIPVLTVVLIFSVAVAKAYLVAAYYMHLRYEPLFVMMIMVAGLACLYVMFFGLVPG
jgi:caa(3)-type oxidase subunit IV